VPKVWQRNEQIVSKKISRRLRLRLCSQWLQRTFSDVSRTPLFL